MALVGNVSGSSQSSSVIGVSGSVIVANRPNASFPSMPGTDTTFFVSGSANTRTDVSVFGGDLVVSGSFIGFGDTMELTGTLTITNGISGSLTKLSDGTSYLVAGTNITITSQSNGSVLISATDTQGDDFFDSTTAGSIFTTGSAAFRGGESAIDSPADKGTDVFFYVSGSTDGASKSLFGGSIVVSGSADVKGSTTLGDSSGDTVAFNANVSTNIIPSVDNAYNLGSATNRWANVYTGDLHLKNDRGNWTLIEEENYLTLRNNDTGKVYKLLMELIEG
jgi:hypothetical protein